MKDRKSLDAGADTRGANVAFIGVAKSYGVAEALRPTTLEVNSGEFFAILGPSGSGKSTLLGIAAGYVTPTEGQIVLNGEDILGRPPYRRNIGMVFQNYALFPHMTVRENVSFPLRMRGGSTHETSARVKRMLEIVRLTGLEERRPSELSGGQQQRVALARAAVYDPLLLLMDEPLGALDKNLRETVQDEIKRFQRTLGATVIYVTHDQQEAAAMADRVAIMRNGEIIQVGTPEELYERPCNLFVASFLGEANVLPLAGPPYRDAGDILQTRGGLALRFTNARHQSPQNHAMVACVRPEQIFAAGAAESGANLFETEIVDVTYTIGGFRYRVRLPDRDGTILAWRPHVREDVRRYAGDKVRIGWHAHHTLLLTIEDDGL